MEISFSFYSLFIFQKIKLIKQRVKLFILNLIPKKITVVSLLH